MFLVYAGSNEVVGPYGPGTVLTASSMTTPVIRASIFVRSSRIGQLLAGAGGTRAEWRGMEMFLDKQVSADSPLMGRAYRNFERNLRSIVEVAHAAGARVLLSTIVTNLRDCPPFGSSHRSGLNEGALETWKNLVQQGIAKESAGSYDEALKLYTSAAQLDDRYAELDFRIAHCYWSLGNFEAALAHYTRARDLDTLRFRADSRINDAIRSVGNSSGTSAELLDAANLLAAESHSGIIGSELLYDHVHFTPAGNYLLARAAFERIVKDLPFTEQSVPNSTEPLSEAECETLLALTGHERSRIAAEMAERLQRPPFTTQLNHAAQLQNLMFRAAGNSESVQDAVSQYEFAIAHSPDDLLLHHKFGLFLFNYDPNAAAQQLVLGRPTDDFPIFMPDGTPIQ
jgi:tetratricopeptide (TPR) repeat protein